MNAASGAPPRDEDHPATAMADRAAATRHAARSGVGESILAKATRFLPSRLAS